MTSRAHRLVSVHSQYIDRGNNVFTTSIPRPEADGKETEKEGKTSESTQLHFRQANTKPVFFYSKNRNSTDVAFRHRQSQKDAPFTPNLHTCLYEKKNISDLQPGEGLLQELYQQQCEQLNTVEGDLAEARKERDRSEEKCMLNKAELATQIQVNKELKKLLVASMGSDLQTQLENLARDRAQLAQDLENTVATLLKEREALERIHIQCDVWRSKFLGSRLQVDELITSRTNLDMLQQESCHALQKLLDERAEMRRHTMKTNRLLQYLSSALQRNHSITEEGTATPSNVITLALVNEQLASTISHVLLGDVGGHQAGSKGNGHKGFEFVDWTTAEMLAKDIVLNKQPGMKLEQMHQKARLQGPIPKVNMTHRYHPHTRFDNITINCCKYCKGELQVV